MTTLINLAALWTVVAFVYWLFFAVSIVARRQRQERRFVLGEYFPNWQIGWSLFNVVGSWLGSFALIAMGAACDGTSYVHDPLDACQDLAAIYGAVFWNGFWTTAYHYAGVICLGIAFPTPLIYLIYKAGEAPSRH